MAKTKRKPTKAKESTTYKLIELVGVSTKSYEDAIRGAVADAGKTVKGLSWFEVAELRGHIENGEVAQFQAKVKVAFKVIH